MAFYDVTYLNPIGIQGIHYAVEAASKEEAEKLSPVMLSYNSPFTPDQFKVISVVESCMVPQPTLPEEIVIPPETSEA